MAFFVLGEFIELCFSINRTEGNWITNDVWLIPYASKFDSSLEGPNGTALPGPFDSPVVSLNIMSVEVKYFKDFLWI